MKPALSGLLTLALILFGTVSGHGQDHPNVVFLGDDHAPCSIRSLPNGHEIICNVQGFSILDLQNNLQISCSAAAAKLGTWYGVAGSIWERPEGAGHPPCYRRKFTPPPTLKGAKFLQNGSWGGNVISPASLLYSYDPDAQTLGFCVVPRFSHTGTVMEVLCNAVELQDSK
jgi:hypothetical protein